MLTHHLPSQPTSFVGRENELAEIADLLATPACRLLTLTGPGGIGKTRLALEAARLHLDSPLPEGEGLGVRVFFVPLQPLGSPDFTVPAIAEALHFSFFGEQDPKTQLLHFLHEKHLLLVLDNFEHLLDGTVLLPDILDSAPGVKLLVTSRERLHLREEWVLDIRGLDVPENGRLGSLADHSATHLFTQHARRTGYTPQDADTAAIVRICQLVEGMPLAIELAAAWVRVMPCLDIAREIEHSLDILTTTLRNVPDKHRSMRAVFDASWKLLSDDEQAVFRKLSVFCGGFTREAAEQVAGASLPTLAALVDKSLLRVAADGGYDLHELLQQYTEEQLDAAQESQEVRGLHCAYYAEFMRQCADNLRGRRQKAAFAAIKAELDNTRAAWQWAIEHGNVEEIGRAVHSLYVYAEVGDLAPKEAEIALESAVKKLSALSTNPSAEAVLGIALTRQSHLCYALGYNQQLSIERCRESLAIFQRLGLQEEMALALRVLGLLLCWRGDYDEARLLLHESLAIYRQSGNLYDMACILQALGSAADSSAVFNDARQFFQEALEIFHELECPIEIAWCYGWLGQTAIQQAQYTEAQKLIQCSLTHFEESDNQRRTAALFNSLGEVASVLGKPEEAYQYFTESLKVAREFSDVDLSLRFVVGMAGALMNAGNYELAVEVFTFVLHHPQPPQLVKDKAEHLLEAELKPHLLAEGFVAAQDRGRARTLEEVLDILDDLGHAAQIATETPSNVLTSRELEILHLIADGVPTRKVAQQLFLSVVTVRWYLNQIYSKLYVHSRVQAIARARELNLLS